MHLTKTITYPAGNYLPLSAFATPEFIAPNIKYQSRVEKSVETRAGIVSQSATTTSELTFTIEVTVSGILLASYAIAVAVTADTTIAQAAQAALEAFITAKPEWQGATVTM